MTAKELLESSCFLPSLTSRNQVLTANTAEVKMIAFAKYHVKLALKAKVDAMIKEGKEDSSFSLSELDAFTKDSYPLENIK